MLPLLPESPGRSTCVCNPRGGLHDHLRSHRRRPRAVRDLPAPPRPIAASAVCPQCNAHSTPTAGGRFRPIQLSVTGAVNALPPSPGHCRAANRKLLCSMTSWSYNPFFAHRRGDRSCHCRPVAAAPPTEKCSALAVILEGCNSTRHFPSRAAALARASGECALPRIQLTPLVRGRRSSEICVRCPLHPAGTQQKMAAAAYGAPDRGPERDGLSIRVELDCPDRASSGNEVKLDDVAAPARARHGCAREVTVLAHEVNLPGAEFLREIFNHDRSVRRRFPRDNLPQPEPDLLDQDQGSDPRLGICSGGLVSPRPTKVRARGEAHPSRSCSVCA